MDIKNIHQSKTVRGVLIGLGVAAVLLIVFAGGMHVGVRKAQFSYKYGDNYYRTFEGRQNGGPGGMMMFPLGGRLPGGHGAAGKILRIELPSFIVDGPDGIEKVVVTDKDTEVRHFHDVLDVKDLKTDDFVVVLGEPDDEGRVVAKLIRVMPTPQDQDKKTISASSTNSK